VINKVILAHYAPIVGPHLSTVGTLFWSAIRGSYLILKALDLPTHALSDIQRLEDMMLPCPEMSALKAIMG
jgi:hypothetical protein